MSYYNPYLNYPYTNTGINQFNSPMQATAPQMPMSTQPMMRPSAPPQTLGLNGKIVDSEDVVKATEVPIGGYGIFPKADLSEIYVKTWNNNGTTSVITFQPIAVPQKTEMSNVNNTMINQLFQKIETVENKLDAILSESQKKYPSPAVTEEGKNPLKRKEYLIAKEEHKEKDKLFHELDEYLHELSSDLTEIFDKAMPEEKVMLKIKITAMLEKMK